MFMTSPDENKKVFLITALQITLVLMLAAITLKFLLNLAAFYLIEVALSAGFLKLLFFDLRKELKKEHKFAVYFFAPLFLLIQLSWVAQPFLTTSYSLFYFLGFILVVFLFLAFFGVVFGRPFVEGKVLLSNEKIAVVQTDFDIRSQSTAGTHIVETNKKIQEGQTVKIAFKNTFFGKKKAKIM